MSIAQKLNPLPWFRKYFWKLFLVCVVAMCAYMVYLDAIIAHQFSGNKWQVPAQIYARPLVLSLKEEITSKEIIEELTLLGYRRVAKASRTGEYQYNNNHFEVYRRAFHFPDGFQAETALSLTVKSGRVSSIVNLNSGKQIDSFRLEPWLVTRLISEGKEDRMLVSLGQVPKELVEALVLVEDKDFYQHHGIAPLSILRALIANISAGRAVQGGSTLTQQLVKNMYLTNEKSITRKIKEAFMSILIDARYSKDQIMEAYLNEVFLGQNGNTGVHGFGLASYFYFDRPLNELNLEEMTTLVGMIKGPSYYNPRRHPERVIERRNLVLRLLFEAGKINKTTFEQLLDKPIQVATGATLVRGKHPAFMDRVGRELRTILDNPDIRDSGVKLFTSLDSNAQRKAETALSGGLTSIEKQRKLENLQAAMVVTDIDSGEIRAMVGDRNTGFSGFNRALDAKRSIGSLIKPAIYITALEHPEEYNLATPLFDDPIKLPSEGGETWEPQNADKKFRGQVPLYTALTQSLNVPTVSLGMELGLENITQTLKRLGVTEPITQYPALTLGALDLSPIQVNQVYQTIANNGVQIPLHTVNAIMSADDQLMYSFSSQATRIIDEKVAYLMNYALHKVTLEGTAKQIRRRFPTINMAGKTGTTDDYRDSWFSGYDKNILITSWIGTDDNKSTGLTGASGALRLFMDFQLLQEPKSLVRRFPKGLGIAHFNPQTGRATQAGCQTSMSLPAILEVLPKRADKCDTKNPKIQERKSFWERLFGN
ncbi:penicillin-binding protein 1B [Aliiglaciecola sp. 2_MG-2023]|uniref:penicillin-binding protein 1B n=1 Tax=unclassified Aliiglaciecola TaxID=2593648 RepID=UPI0026E22870|nr:MULTISPECIES: penicillin-binding protein 1B [unclassified Aliiglaciecola]MDO6709601.1 penicillin-binding protein 1B [Aliiglaciecola sp. 2_MG-2023]MDO6750857.1 penicillin-binding protein 1B [Aliiglaciecola sp. 1_MG-2023]